MDYRRGPDGNFRRLLELVSGRWNVRAEFLHLHGEFDFVDYGGTVLLVLAASLATD